MYVKIHRSYSSLSLFLTVKETGKKNTPVGPVLISTGRQHHTHTSIDCSARNTAGGGGCGCGCVRGRVDGRKAGGVEGWRRRVMCVTLGKGVVGGRSRGLSSWWARGLPGRGRSKRGPDTTQGRGLNIGRSAHLVLAPPLARCRRCIR